MTQPRPIVNVDSQAIPPFGVVMPFGGLDSDGLLKVKRPTADNMANVYFNGPNTVQPGDAGQAFTPPCVAAYTGTIAAGDTLGAAANTWLLDKTKTGFVFLDGKNGIGNVDRDYTATSGATDQTLVSSQYVVGTHNDVTEISAITEHLVLWEVQDNGAGAITINGIKPFVMSGGSYVQQVFLVNTGPHNLTIVNHGAVTYPVTTYSGANVVIAQNGMATLINLNSSTQLLYLTSYTPP